LVQTEKQTLVKPKRYKYFSSVRVCFGVWSLWSYL